MKTFKSYFILIILSLFIFAILFSSPVVANHATCTTDSQAESNPYIAEDNECDAVIDWSEMFSVTNMSDGDTLQSQQYEQERLFFTQIPLATNPDINNKLSQNNFYTYEIHSVDESKKINTGTSKTISYNRNDEYSGTNDGSEYTDYNINNFIPNKIRTDVYIPESTSIIIKLQDKDDNTLKTIELNHEDYTYNFEENEQTRIYQPIDLSESGHSTQYNIDIELHRTNEDTESPEISKGIALERETPPYRMYSMGLSSYPKFSLYSYHQKNYISNYKNNIHNGYATDTVLSPSYPKEMYDDYIVENSRHYKGKSFDVSNEARPLRNSYVSIDRIEPSVKVPSGRVGQKWDKIMADEGRIYITYDSAVDEEPRDGNDYIVKRVGSKRWSYSDLQSISYDLKLEAQFEDGTSTIIDDTTRDNSGLWSVSYDKDDINGKNIVRLNSEMSVTIEYERYNEIYQRYLIEERNLLPDLYGKRWEDDSTEKIDDLTHTVEHSEEIDGMDYNDGPDNSDFEINIGMFSDETRAHVDRKLDVDRKLENVLEKTRWTNLESKSIIESGKREIDIRDSDSSNPRTIRIGERRTRADTDVSEGVYEEPTINGEITEDMTVHLDVWAHGNFGENSEISTYVNNEKIKDNEINIQSREQRQHIIQNEDIHNDIVGEDKFKLNNTINTRDSNLDDLQSNPYITYSVTIGVDEPISRINSRWRYWTFRDSQWDNINAILEDCTGEGLRKETIRALGGTCFDLEEKQITPTGAHPMQPHLLPSINQLDVEYLPQQSGYNVENVQYSELSENILHTPIKSPYCSHNLNLESEDRACDVYQGYIANDNIEQAHINDEFEFAGTINTDSGEEDYLSSLEPSDYSYEREYTTSEGDTKTLDYRSLVSDVGTNEFKEESSFEIVSDKSMNDFQISGNTSWTYNDIDTDDIRIVTRTGLGVNTIPKQQLTDEFVTEIEPTLASNNEIKTADELSDGEFQIRLELKDEYNQPINTEKRNTDESIEFVDVYSDGEETNQYKSSSIETNKNGIAYVVVPEHRSTNDYLHTNFEFNATDNWWETPSDVRVLDSSRNQMENQDISDDENEGPEDIKSTIFDTFLAISIVISTSFIVLSMVLRIHPQSNTTAMDMFYTITEPYRDNILEFVKLVILTGIFLMILRVFALYLGA